MTLPLIVGVVVMPKILAGLGIERFGVLSVIWMMIGYFSVFDLGLGRTLTKLVSDRIGSGERREIPQLVSTTLVIVTFSGIVLGIVTAGCAHWLAHSVLHASPTQIHETSDAIRWLAISLPFVLVATALFGLLEAFQEFSMISAVRLPIGILLFIVPVAILPFSKSLAVITATLSVVRIVGAVSLLLLCYRIVPELRGRTFAFYRNLVRPMLTYGGWLTVSNIVSPIMTYFDRFLIAAMAGSAAVAYYTVPYDALSRLMLIPAVLQGVLFPTFVALRYTDKLRFNSVFAKASEVTLLLMFPALLATILFGGIGLRVWMGPDFSAHSAQIARILMVGIFVNAMTRVPFSVVQSAGHADWTAIFHLIQLPLYVVALWWLLRTHGTEGAAYAWTTRVILDAAVFYMLGLKIEPELKGKTFSLIFLTLTLCVSAVALSWLVDDLTVRAVIWASCTMIFGLILFWRFRSSIFNGRLPLKA